MGEPRRMAEPPGGTRPVPPKHPLTTPARPAAACGGAIRNATVGRVVSPGFPGNYSNNLTCHWLLEAPAGHRLHLHFEKVSLAEDDDRFGSARGGRGGTSGQPRAMRGDGRGWPC